MTLRDLLVISGLCFLTEDADEAIRLSLTKEVVHLFGEDAFERMDAIEASNEETVEVMLQILRSLAVDQELLDVKAGIPARDAEIAALRKEIDTLRARQDADTVDAVRYRAWRDALVTGKTAEDDFIRLVADNLPTSVGVSRRPTAAEWDAAIDAARKEQA